MSEEQQTPPENVQISYQELDKKQQLNFKELYPVNESFGCVGISIERGTATLPRGGYVSTADGAMPASITPSSIIENAGTSPAAGWMCYVLLSGVTS